MTEERDEIPDNPPAARRRGLFGLSSKLLMLTLLFVMLAEVLIYVPSIANFQKTTIEAKLRTATVAARALTVSDAALPPDLQTGLLDDLDAFALAVRTGA